MSSPRQVHDWLSWLVKVRVLVITFLLGIELVIRQVVPSPVPVKYFLSLILVAYAVAIFYAILRGLALDPYLQAYVQLAVDLIMVTGFVYLTGSAESYFVLLYPLEIIVASILLSRVGSFLVAALSFICFAGVVNAGLFKLIPSLYPTTTVSIWPLQLQLGINLFAFLGVWYLSSQLAESLRRAGVALEYKRGELEELQAFNENIVQSMRGGLLTTNLGGRILLLNPAGEEILGVSAKRVRGMTLSEAFPDLVALLPLQGRFPGGGRQELNVRTADGRDKILGVTVSLLRTREGTDSGYVYNFQDLTELKRLEAEVMHKEQMAALGRMAAAIAHEIRNPLAAIAGSVRQLARYADMGEDENKLVEIVNRESERLNRLVADILTYSRSKPPRREPTDLRPLLEETLLLMERHPQFNGRIRVEKRLPHHAVVANVDSGQMRQVLWNLCDNAVRAMPEGGVLRVDLEKDADRVRLRVADTGMGLSPAQREKIFEPFESAFPGGTGLGLAVVYQIVQAHGGTVAAEGAERGGTVFSVELPAA
ncbi:MAG TPA: ATP-binding protein [Candidatus Xenobia bacterium]|nr:ATP-binding protein [Candidatus Xenobia bacterium]